MDSLATSQPSSRLHDEEEYVVLTGDPESFATFQMSLLARVSQTEAQQLALQVCQVTQRCSWLHSDLMKHRHQMEALRDQWRERQQQLAERQKQLGEREMQLEGAMKHYADQESARRQMQLELERQRAQCGELTEKLQRARATVAATEEQMRKALEAERAMRRAEAEEAARQQAASVDAERAQFLAQLEGFGRQRKQLQRLGQCSERQADEMASAIEQLSGLPACHREETRRLQRRVAELEAQAVELRSELAKKAAETSSEEEQKEKEKFSGEEAAKKLDTIDEGDLTQSQKFEAMASKELQLLECQESLKEQLRVQADDRDRLLKETQRLQEAFRAAEQHHQMELQSVRKCSQFKEAKLLSADKQVQELGTEVKRLAAREKELSQRCLDCNNTVCEILAGTERERRDTQSELAMAKSKLSNSSEALQDYAEKMKEKAAVEFELKGRIRELMVQLDQLKRNSAPR